MLYYRITWPIYVEISWEPSSVRSQPNVARHKTADQFNIDPASYEQRRRNCACRTYFAKTLNVHIVSEYKRKNETSRRSSYDDKCHLGEKNFAGRPSTNSSTCAQFVNYVTLFATFDVRSQRVLFVPEYNRSLYKQPICNVNPFNFVMQAKWHELQSHFTQTSIENIQQTQAYIDGWCI